MQSSADTRRKLKALVDERVKRDLEVLDALTSAQKEAILARKRVRDNATWESYRDGGRAGQVSGEHEDSKVKQTQRDATSVSALVASKQRALAQSTARIDLVVGKDSTVPRSRL